MSASLIRGKYVICRVENRTDAVIVEDGAVLQRDGRIVEVGSFPELSRKHRVDDILGSPEHIVLPGFVNGHHHVGLTPFQLGSPDDPVELSFARRLEARDVDPYLDTLYSAFEMVESGVTTVQHLQGLAAGSIDALAGAAGNVIRAYQDVGMRVSYSYGLKEQNRFVYEADDEYVKRLPPDIAPRIAKILKSWTLPFEDNFTLFEELQRRYGQDERVRIQLSPSNLHWCSDEGLARANAFAERWNVPMHMHLLETPYQREYARRRTGTTAVRHLQKLGVLGPRLTIGHGVWLTEDDIDLIAETGTHVCHLCSSNLRLRSGIAPLNRLAERGIPVGIGIDEAGINDDRDMLQEMRLILVLHREPGMDDRPPTAPQVLKMATEHGARTTPFGETIGVIEPGKAADMVLMRWQDIAYPYLEQGVPVIDAVLQRAKAAGVDTVLVAGEPILRDRRFTRIDKDSALKELAARLSQPLTADELARRELARKVFPHVQRFYEDYIDLQAFEPFYKNSARR